MKNYYPERMELGPRDVVARATYNEILDGRGTKHGGVWLDVTHLSKAKNFGQTTNDVRTVQKY